MDEWRNILLGEGRTWTFLIECLVRTVVMFTVMLLLFKLTGKKEVRQFSTLELIVIIGLGSALGDPMMHPDAPLLPAIVVILVVLLLYRAMNHWTNHAPRVGEWVEGVVVKVLDNGVIDRKALDKEGISVEEFFGDLRTKHVEHLGQVKAAHVEVDGAISVFFHAKEDVRPGLPIHVGWEDALRSRAELPAGSVSCGQCGYTSIRLPTMSCEHCGEDRWAPASVFERVA
ncbi:MAG: DUF421 domain-containing protein [Flavobacteriales bacterium]|nr:DUF421 domain-containing protein [Flavobacteriales bacterium]